MSLLQAFVFVRYAHNTSYVFNSKLLAISKELFRHTDFDLNNASPIKLNASFLLKIESLIYNHVCTFTFCMCQSVYVCMYLSSRSKMVY